MTSFGGTDGRRLVVVLMVIAAGVLLALPVTAGAHVAKKHKREYRASVEGCGTSMMRHKDAYDRIQIDVDGAADEIGPLLGSEDPADKANLAGLQLMEAMNAAA
jgi:hypothetical protein